MDIKEWANIGTYVECKRIAEEREEWETINQNIT